MNEQVPSNTLLARIETWLRDKDRGQKYACVRGYRRNEAGRNCEGCLLTDAKSEIEATRDMLIDARLEIDALRAALGVNYEPHQSLHERMLDAANHKRVERTALEPPDECDGCEQYAVMHAEIALALDIHDETDAHGLQELILKKLRAAQPLRPEAVEALRPFVELYEKVDERYRKRGGNPDVFKDSHPFSDIPAGDLPMGVWRRAQAAYRAAQPPSAVENTRVQFIAEAAKRDDTDFRTNAPFYVRDLLLHIHGMIRERKPSQPPPDALDYCHCLQPVDSADSHLVCGNCGRPFAQPPGPVQALIDAAIQWRNGPPNYYATNQALRTAVDAYSSSTKESAR